MTFRRSIARCLVAGAVAVLSTPGSFAAPLNVLTDKSQWDALVSNVTTIDFDKPGQGYAVPAANDWALLTTDTLVTNGVTFTNLWGATLQKLILSNYNTWNSGTVLKSEPYAAGQLNSIHLDLATGVTAFGVDLIALAASDTFTIKIGADSYNTTGVTGRNFYGVTTTTPFTSVDIFYTNNYTNAAIDNVRLAGVAAQQPPPDSSTPEAATMILCATGLVSLSRAAKRRMADG